MWRQPKAVWAVAFASVVAFMGIGLVDPILKPIADNLDATPSQVSLLFTSYMAVMGVAMLVTGVVSSRIGAKRTLLAGLVLIIVFAALAGSSGSVGAVIGFLCVAPAIKMNGLFGQNSPALIAIQALYPAVQFTLMGAILGLWH